MILRYMHDEDGMHERKFGDYIRAEDYNNLVQVCMNLLLRWHKSGPDGSAQWEKFDKVIRDMKIAVQKAEGLDSNGNVIETLKG